MNTLTRLSIAVPLKTPACSVTTTRQRLGWIERFRRSGQSQRAFAQAHGLKLSQFRYWLYDPVLAAKNPCDVPRLQEVSLVPRFSQSGWSAEISLPAGPTVRLNERLARELIGPLLQVCPPSHV
jgi:hypothetical protein